MRGSEKLSITILLLGIAMLTAPLPALANHHDIGTRATIVQADEVAANGTLQPDIPPDSMYNQVRYHVNLEEDDLPARTQPADQTGDRYTDCEKAGDLSEEDYKAGLTAAGNSCYVGYLDLQWEYQLEDVTWMTATGLNEAFPGNFQSLYPVHPDDPNDGENDDQDSYCRGQDDTEDITGVEDVDVLATRANRTAQGLNDGDHQCSGEDHEWRTERRLWVDADLLEPAHQAEDLHAEEDPTAVAPPGSGYITLPFITQTHVLLYGQPHPDADIPEEDRVTAAEVNQRAAGLTFPSDNPCGDRTSECVLLTPEDIIEYDNSHPRGIAPGDGTTARVCRYSPQFGLNNAEGLPTECGPQGRVVSDFFSDFESGGFAQDDVTGGLPTWVSVVPGWLGGSFLSLGEAGHARQAIAEMEDVYSDSCCLPAGGISLFAEGGQIEYGRYLYLAVNPTVPKPADSTWCIRPGFLTDGESNVDLSGESDPGVYGTYIADAIDTDVRPGTLQNQYLWMQKEHKDTVRDGPVTSPVPLPEEVAGVPLDNDPDDDKIGLREIENIGRFLTNPDTGDVELPGAVGELFNRTSYTESEDEDPDVPTPQTPRDDEDLGDLRYSRTLDPGLRCDFRGQLSLTEGSVTQEGAVQFNIDVEATPDVPGVVSTSIWPKDPTALSEFMGVPLPAEEGETERNGWQIDHYSFEGLARAQSDSNQNGVFDDDCVEANGQPQPDRDVCDWRAIWDAYNTGCRNSQGKTCGEAAESRGYDIDAGVGLYFVVITDGPTVVEDVSSTAPEYTVLGDEDTTATHCIVGTSQGFLPKLTSGVNGFADKQDFLDTVCADADSEPLVFEDAFADQEGADESPFDSEIHFYKLVPTPDAADEVNEWQGFEICVTGVWNTLNGQTATDTVGNIELSGHQEYSDCDAFYDA